MVLAAELIMRSWAEVDMSRPSVKSEEFRLGFPDSFTAPISECWSQRARRFPRKQAKARWPFRYAHATHRGSAPPSLSCDSRKASPGSSRNLVARWERLCVPGSGPFVTFWAWEATRTHARTHARPHDDQKYAPVCCPKSPVGFPIAFRSARFFPPR